MSCRSENMDPDEIITDQVTTTQTCIKAESSGREDMVAMDNASTQEDLVHVPLKSVEVSSVKEINCQANYSSSISDQKYAMKEVSTQVSFSPTSMDHKFSLDEVPNQSSKKKRDETPEQRLKRLERQRNYYNQRKQTESPDKREARLSKMRELATRRRENESQLQREERLSQLRMYAVKRIANESTDQREQRLRNMRIYAENRLANETLEQRQRRLGHAPFNAQEKKVGERRERKGHAEGGSCEERSTDSVPGEAFGGHDRLYEPQGQFQEYLSQLGLGIVEQRVSQMQEQYHYGHPRNLVPDQEKYIGHFNQLASNLTHGQFGHQRHLVPEHAQFGQVSQEKFAGLATHGQPCTSERRPHESQEQYLQRTRQVNLYVPDRAHSQQGQQVAQQGHHQVQKKVTEVKMYEVL